MEPTLTPTCACPTTRAGSWWPLDGSDALAEACNARGFATAMLDLTSDKEHADTLAAELATAATALAHDPSLRDRPVGYFGTGTGAAAALIAAALHVNEVAAVVAVDTPVELTGTHLSAVRAPTLLLVRDGNDDILAGNERAQVALEGASRELSIVSGEDVANSAASWFDLHLRGIMRAQRREVWRQLQ